MLLHNRSNDRREEFQHAEKRSVWRGSLSGAVTLGRGLQPTHRNFAGVEPADQGQLLHSPFILDPLMGPHIAQT